MNPCRGEKYQGPPRVSEMTEIKRTWRLVYFSQQAPEDADFADYDSKELLIKHLEDALGDDHIIIITQITEERKE